MRDLCLAPLEVVLRTGLLQDCLISLGKNTLSSSGCHGNRLRARILAYSSSAQQRLASVPGLWLCPYPTASWEQGSEVTQGPHCAK